MGIRGKGPTYQVDCHTPNLSSNACDFPLKSLGICSPFPNTSRSFLLWETAKSPALGKTRNHCRPLFKMPSGVPYSCPHFSGVERPGAWGWEVLEEGGNELLPRASGSETKMAKEEELEASTQGPCWEGQRMRAQAQDLPVPWTER